MNIYIIDNYDSFTYNLSHLVKSLNADVTVLRNDKFDIADLRNADKIILSPGPGIPEEAGLTLKVIDTYKNIKPILGVCLGHQAIGQYFGAKLINLTEVYHGVQTPVTIDTKDYIFEGLSQSIQVGRYHSWIVSNIDFPKNLSVLSKSANGEIMALKHQYFDIRGIQFHPESILTPEGQQIISNWLKH